MHKANRIFASSARSIFAAVVVLFPQYSQCEDLVRLVPSWTSKPEIQRPVPNYGGAIATALENFQFGSDVACHRKLQASLDSAIAETRRMLKEQMDYQVVASFDSCTAHLAPYHGGGVDVLSKSHAKFNSYVIELHPYYCNDGICF